MEKDIQIKTSDKKVLYGTLGTTKKKSSTLVIFVHGFTGHSNEHIFFNGSKYFAEKGFDTFRFNLYAWGKHARHFKEVSLNMHGADIDTVAKYFRKKYKTIVVVGHSYGGTSLLLTNQVNIDKYVFWDASYITPKDATEDITELTAIDRYVVDYGIEILVGKKFIDSLRHFPSCAELIKKIHKPVLVVVAGKDKGVTLRKKYFVHANEPKKLVHLKDADHNFNHWKDEKELLEETYTWVTEK